MDRRTKEAVRYLGYGKSTVDTKTLRLISESFQELDGLTETKSYYQVYETTFLEDDKLLIGQLEIESRNLRTNLHGCKEAVLFGATLGIAVDRQIHKYGLLDMARAVVFQACAAAYLEEYCDEQQAKLAEIFAEEGGYLRPRFSPGYGDLSIFYQKEILLMLDAAKRIGLTMTDGYMLTPTKSVTAVIGISNTNECCHKKGCEECAKKDCDYRRSE